MDTGPFNHRFDAARIEALAPQDMPRRDKPVSFDRGTDRAGVILSVIRQLSRYLSTYTAADRPLV